MILDFLKKLFSRNEKKSLKYTSVNEKNKLETFLNSENIANKTENSNTIVENTNDSKFINTDETPFEASKNTQVIKEIPVNQSDYKLEEEELPFGNVSFIDTSKIIKETTKSIPQLVEVNKSSVPVEEEEELPFGNVPYVDTSKIIKETTKNTSQLIEVNKSSVPVEEEEDLSLDNIENNLFQNDNNISLNTIIKNEIQDKNTLEVFCKNDTFLANGIYSLTDNSLTVISKSTINLNVDDFASKHFSNKYRDNPLYVDDNFKVLQDIKFNTPSGASIFVYGKKSNGPIVWKTENNVSLIEYLKQNPFLIDNMEYNSTTKVIIDYVCKFKQNTNSQENLSIEDSSNDVIEQEKTSLKFTKDTIDVSSKMEDNEYLKNNTINLNFIVVDGIITNKDTQKTVDNNSIDCLNLSTRAYNALRRVNIISLKDLLCLSFNDINRIKNLGTNSINEIINKLDLYLTNKTDDKNISMDKNIRMDINNNSIDSLHLSVRAKNSLRQIGIFNVNQLIELEDAKLYHIKNCGEKTILEIISIKKELFTNITSNLENIPTEILNYLKDFFNELSYFDITEVQLYSIQYSLVSLLDGTEINRISYYNKWYSEIHIQEYIKNYILKVCNENHFYGISLVELKFQIIKNTLIQEELLDKILEDLKNNQLEQVQENRYILKYPNVLEYISSLDKISSQSIYVLEKRIKKGDTLVSISNDLNITRERVRQIQNRCINIMQKNLSSEKMSIKEERFKPLFEKYQLSEELFVFLTQDTSQAYNYLNMMYEKGKTPIEKILNDNTIPNWIVENYRKYLKQSINAIFLCVQEDNNRMIKKTRKDIEIYVLSKYCCDECTFDEFVDRYQQFLCKYNLENNEALKITDSERRSQENQLSQSSFVLWKYGKRLRYYNITEHDYTELLQTLNLEQYENIEISTLKFIREYPNTMKKYDIRDEYELHNLLRKIGFGENNPNINFSMPHICLGEFNREEAIKNFLFELAPISAEDLANALSNEYGFQVSTVTSWFKCIQEYYKDGIYSIDYQELPENHIKLLQENLIDDFYYISQIKEIYKNLVPNADVTLISSFNLKKMGFIVYSTYVIQHHSSATNYFKFLLTNQDIIDISKFNSRNILQLFYRVLENLKDNYDIIEFEPYQYINIRKLNTMGIDKSNLIAYCDDVYNYIDDGSYFTVKSLLDKGFSSNIDFLGFENYFYSSILKQDKRFSYIRFKKNVLFYKGNKNINKTDFLIYLLNPIEKIDLNELLEYISQKYEITLNKFKLKECIKNSNLYYDDIMEKIYYNYDVYLEELNSIDDDIED